MSFAVQERERRKTLPGFHIKESCEAIAQHMPKGTA